MCRRLNKTEVKVNFMASCYITQVCRLLTSDAFNLASYTHNSTFANRMSSADRLISHAGQPYWISVLLPWHYSVAIYWTTANLLVSHWKSIMGWKLGQNMGRVIGSIATKSNHLILVLEPRLAPSKCVHNNLLILQLVLVEQTDLMCSTAFSVTAKCQLMPCLLTAKNHAKQCRIHQRNRIAIKI